jgi:chaperonin GroEL
VVELHYYMLVKELKNLDSIGSQIVYQACGKPFEQILINAGYSSTDAQMIGKYRLVESGNDIWAGYNLKTEEVVNMKEAGIIDPTKVTRTALENAASVAGTLLLTECTLVPLMIIL